MYEKHRDSLLDLAIFVHGMQIQYLEPHDLVSIRYYGSFSFISTSLFRHSYSTPYIVSQALDSN